MDPQRQRKHTILEELAKYPYKVPRWLKNNNLHTLFAALPRRKGQPFWTRERWKTPDDDFLCIYQHEGAKETPFVLLLHGLEGHARSPYIAGMAHLFLERDWGVAAMEYRSCSGEINLQPRLYHSGTTDDVDFVIRRLLARYPNRPFYLAGVSLGANMLVKWLGEVGSNIPAQIQGSAAMSSPFSLTMSAAVLEKACGRLYVKWFLHNLIPKALEKAKQYPGLLDVEAIKRCKTFEDFDTRVTAVLHGFEDAWDYWARCECGQFLEEIRCPTLLVSAVDDPMAPPESLDWPKQAAEESPYLYGLWPEHGGHVGFVMGTPWRPRYWAEEQISRFFALCEQHPLP